MGNPHPDDVLCKMRYGSTCAGTDINRMDGPHLNPVHFPTILGHGSVGRVEETGARVRHFRVGELISRVGAPLGLLPELNASWGGFAEYGIARDHWQMRRDGLDISQWNAHRINPIIHPAINEKTAPMVITWRVTLFCINRLGISAGNHVLIIGSGANALAFYVSYSSPGLAEEVRQLMGRMTPPSAITAGTASKATV